MLHYFCNLKEDSKKNLSYSRCISHEWRSTMISFIHKISKVEQRFTKENYAVSTMEYFNKKGGIIKQNHVYKFDCKECKSCYIGET